MAEPRLSVRLFGRFSAQSDGQGVLGLDGAKVQELFSYLLLHAGRPHSRETLASLMWSDNLAPQSKKYLRQTLWELQTALDARLEGLAPALFWVEVDWVQLSLNADVWLDVSDFEGAFSQVKGVPGEALDETQVVGVCRAVELYEGDLLEGCHQDWCLLERERLQIIYLALLDKLMGYSEARQEYETGLMYGLRILRYDRARESTHQRLMRLYYLMGDRVGALRQFHLCAQILRDELDVKPARRTLALYEQIRQDQLEVNPPPPPRARLALRPSDIESVLHHLHRIQGAVVTLQGQVREEMDLLEALLRRGA